MSGAPRIPLITVTSGRSYQLSAVSELSAVSDQLSAVSNKPTAIVLFHVPLPGGCSKRSRCKAVRDARREAYSGTHSDGCVRRSTARANERRRWAFFSSLSIDRAPIESVRSLDEPCRPRPSPDNHGVRPRAAAEEPDAAKEV